MMRFFRRGGVAQLVVGAVAVTIIIVFALEFRPGRGAVGRLTEKCAVRVYDSCVDEKEYQAASGLIIPYGTSPKAVKELGLRRQIIDGLTERELLLAEADRLGLAVSDSAVEDELAMGRFRVSLPVGQRTLSRSLFLCKVDPRTDQCEPGTEMLRYVPDVKSVETGEFDYKKYERIVRNVANRGPREFKEMQKRELLAARIRDLVRARVRVSVEEARAQFERERSKATIRSVSIKRDWFGRYLVDLSDSKVDDWVKQHKAAVDAAWEAEKSNFTADCPLVSEIGLYAAPDATEADKAELQKRLEDAVKRLKSGEAFAQVARHVSQTATATSGGYLGCLNDAYGPGAAELLKSLSNLKPSDVSSIVTTAAGEYLLKFHGKLKKDEIESVGRRAVARRLAVRERADELAKSFATQLIGAAKSGRKLDQATRELSEEFLAKGVGEEGSALSPSARASALADDVRPKLEVSAPFSSMNNPIPDALPSETPALKAFALDKADAVYGTPIVTEQGFAVMQLKEKELAKPEQFQREREQIVHNMQSAKASDALIRYMAALRKAAAGQTALDARLLDEPASTSGDS